jgi:lipopolysaccharide/colanic/teichoic acid biosynthesis glycosyltransferase
VSSLRINQGPELNVQTAARTSCAKRQLLNDEEFGRMLALERKRSERTRAPFLLMLADRSDPAAQEPNGETLAAIGVNLLAQSRETDVVGWYQDRKTLGVLFTGLSEDSASVTQTIAARVQSTIERELALDEWKRIRLAFHLFPDDWDLNDSDHLGNPALYVDITLSAKRKRVLLTLKRISDLVLSAFALILCSPIFLLCATAIKATSRGPVFFRQKRIGQYGTQFTLLKFRSMYEDNNEQVHKKFVTDMIADQKLEGARHTEEQGYYKIKHDNRVTRVGGFLRRTSLDELPQLLNVLKGEMSLVGPRPAIPYEVEVYQTWHRQRVLAAKPGITGIWQVAGRSRVKFDEMVRMDLRYAMSWTPWLDIKILLLTPLAVIRGTGAF